jgi:hypothetical protein
VVTVGGYYLAAVRPPAPAPAVAVESAARQDRAASAESSGVASVDPATPDPASPSPDERPAFIKQGMRKSMDGLRNQYVEELVARGLARLDSERIVDEFAAGIVDCLFDVASKDYEAHGYTLDEFLHGAKMIWTTSGSSIDLKHLPSSTASCAINVSQQAGLPLAVGFEPRQRPGSEPAEVPVSARGPSLGETEAAIRSHIAKYPQLALTDLFIHCEVRGCEILMQGQDIRIFDLEFDRFAEQNGFRHAVVGGDAGFRSVWLQR